VRATLSFTLPDEQSEFDAAIQASEAKNLLWHIDQHLRGIVKHGNPTEAERTLAEGIRTMIRESDVTID
jgi:hypothetical protein